MGLNPPIPLIFHRWAGHLGHSWRRQLEESLYSVGGQLLGCMSNLNSQVMTLTGPSVPQQGRLFMPCLPKSLESESHVVRHYPHLQNILIGNLHIVIFSHQVQGPDLRDPSQLSLSKEMGAISKPLKQYCPGHLLFFSWNLSQFLLLERL